MLIMFKGHFRRFNMFFQPSTYFNFYSIALPDRSRQLCGCLLDLRLMTTIHLSLFHIFFSPKLTRWPASSIIKKEEVPSFQPYSGLVTETTLSARTWFHVSAAAAASPSCCYSCCCCCYRCCIWPFDILPEVIASIPDFPWVAVHTYSS